MSPLLYVLIINLPLKQIKPAVSMIYPVNQFNNTTKQVQELYLTLYQYFYVIRKQVGVIKYKIFYIITM